MRKLGYRLSFSERAEKEGPGTGSRGGPESREQRKAAPNRQASPCMRGKMAPSESQLHCKDSTAGGQNVIWQVSTLRVCVHYQLRDVKVSLGLLCWCYKFEISAPGTGGTISHLYFCSHILSDMRPRARPTTITTSATSLSTTNHGTDSSAESLHSVMQPENLWRIKPKCFIQFHYGLCALLLQHHLLVKQNIFSCCLFFFYSNTMTYFQFASFSIFPLFYVYSILPQNWTQDLKLHL